MKTLLRLLIGFIGAATIGCASAAPVLLISIDGLHPHYVTRADRYGLRIPTLRRLLKDGAHASGVIGVTPTVTYPSHTTIMTGLAPAEHGIASNTTFDPLNVNREGWYWYAEDIRGATLWSAAAGAGLRTASVNWPVTVGEKHIQYLLAEYWRASTADDLKMLRALDHPDGLLERLEAKLGPFVDGYVDTIESDRVRTRFSLEILREHRPQFMAVHLIALDGVEHREGPWVSAAFEVLEETDQMIGRLIEAARANDPSTVVAIVSDHGFQATHTAVNLRTRFVEAGLIRLKDGAQPTIAEWDAQLWPAAAVAAVMLRDPEDARTRERVASLLQSLAADERNGVARVLSRADAQATGGFPGAEFLVEFAPGFYFGSELRGPLLTRGASKGTHGYLPDREEMHASFFIAGASIAAGRNLGVIDMRQIAPTLAAALGVEWPRTTQRALPAFELKATEAVSP